MQVLTYTTTPVLSQYEVIVPELAMKNIIGVFKDGIKFKLVTVTPTDGTKEVQYCVLTGKFTFSVSFDGSEVLDINYQTL